MSGALRALYDGAVPIDAAGIERSGSFVIYTIVGGVGTLFGPVIGTGAIMYLETILSAHITYWRLIEGVIFVAVIIFLPAGIVGTLVKRFAPRAQSRALIARSIGLERAE